MKQILCFKQKEVTSTVSGKPPKLVNQFTYLGSNIASTESVMVPTLWTIMISSYYYEYQENIHLGVKLTPA